MKATRENRVIPLKQRDAYGSPRAARSNSKNRSEI